MRKLYFSLPVIALAVVGCDTVQQQAAKNPEAAVAVVEAGCAVGEVALAALPVVGAFSGIVADLVCDKIRAGVTPAAAIDFGDENLNALYAISEISFPDDPAKQAELDRMRAALAEAGR